MITYQGMNQKNKQWFLLLKSDENEIQIPIEDFIAHRINKYLQKITLPAEQLASNLEEEQ